MILPKFSFLKDTESPGFTLIELLVATTIMIILAGGGLAAYGQYNKRQQIAAAGAEFSQFLRSTQKRITSGDIGGCTDTLESYTITLISGTSNYNLDIICGGNVPQPTSPLPHNAIFLSDNSSIVFDPLTGAVSSGSQFIEIESEDSCFIYTIFIEDSGTIEDLPVSEQSC